jgi:hypothetical protein
MVGAQDGEWSGDGRKEAGLNGPTNLIIYYYNNKK